MSGKPPFAFRFMLWFDPTGAPKQCAMAMYVEGEKRTEVTWTPGPFDTIEEVLAHGLKEMDHIAYEQLQLLSE